MRSTAGRTEHEVTTTRRAGRAVSAALAAALAAGIAAPAALAQSTTVRTATATSGAAATTDDATQRTRLASADDSRDQWLDHAYQRFYTTYRLGPEDTVAIRVANQPDYSIDRTVISPMGRVYHPLVGEIDVAGMTVDQATDKLRTELAEYIINPQVSLVLLDSKSAKVGVVGDVTHPGIVTMPGPMNVLEAINAAGGVTTFGKATEVTVLRQLGAGQMKTMEVNVKRIMEGKSQPGENFALQAGDTIVVHGNKKKALAFVSGLAGFASFTQFISPRQ
jgi:polysaccharide export outer membrane protein